MQDSLLTVLEPCKIIAQQVQSNRLHAMDLAHAHDSMGSCFCAGPV